MTEEVIEGVTEGEGNINSLRFFDKGNEIEGRLRNLSGLPFYLAEYKFMRIFSQS